MDQASANPFGTRTLAFIIGAGLVLLIGFLLMSGFGNALTPANPIHPSATSRAGIGFAGLRQIIERTGLAGDDDDATADWDHPGLLILTPRIDTTKEQIAEIIDYRSSSELATLIVLPKWAVAPLEGNRNWAEGHGLLPVAAVADILPLVDGGLTFPIGRTSPAEVLAPEGFVLPATVQATPHNPFDEQETRNAIIVLTDHPGEVYLMTDPDIINNIGMKSSANAVAAIRQFTQMSALSGPVDIAFDMTLPRGGAERNLVQLMFTPPFLAVTIAVFAAAVLAGFASANRFGPVRREARAVAFGRSALIDNIAALTRAARRVTGGGARHADAARERIAKRLHAPPDLSNDALTAWLDARAPGYAHIDHRLRHARTESELLEAARDLNDLQREMTR
jgi:hypothetical protein